MTDLAATIGALPGAAEVRGTFDRAVRTLDRLGVQPFSWKTAALFASQLPGAPLGIVPAVVGAVAGPHTPVLPGDRLVVDVLGMRIDLNAVRSGELFIAFAPAGIVVDTAQKDGMTVMWLNLSTCTTGSSGMGSLTDVVVSAVLSRANPFGGAVERAARMLIDATVRPALNTVPQAGLRAAIVETGPGLVVALVCGKVTHATGTAYFPPAVGITRVR